MTVWYTSELGWQSGQNVSNELKTMIANDFKPGDTLVVDGMYNVSGSYLSLPTDFTMFGENGGGFNVITSPTDTSPLFVVKSGSTIENMIFNAPGTPNTGITHANGKVGVDYHGNKILYVKGDNVTISDSSFSGNVSQHIDVLQSKNLKIEGTEFDGAFYQVRVVGASDDMVVTDSVFKHSLGDGIKTERYFGDGPQRMVVENSLFYDNNRDGIDAAGGFVSGKVSNSVFYDNGVTGIDLKKIIELPSDLDPSTGQTDILIENSIFTKSPNGIVVTMLDRLNVLNSTNANDLMPHDIHVADSVFDSTGRAFLIKDGYDITWENLTFHGVEHEKRIMNVEAPSGWSPTNVGGTYTDAGGSLNKPVSYYWSQDVGPSATAKLNSDSGNQVQPESDNIFAELEPNPPVVVQPDPPVVQPDPPAVEEEPTINVPDQQLGTGNTLFEIPGALTLDGSQNKVIEVAPTSDINVDSATISFAFKANTTSKSMGLVSRDAYGSAENSGHFTSYLSGSTLHVRYQNGNDSAALQVSGIQANRTYEVATAFGDGKVGLWLDGVLVAEETMNISWAQNNEYLQVGANGWASGTGQSGFRDMFLGTISDVKILSGYASFEETVVVPEPQPQPQPDPVEPDPVVEQEPVIADELQAPIVDDAPTVSEDPPVVEPVEEPAEEVIEEPVVVPEVVLPEVPAQPAPKVYVDPITGDNELTEFEQDSITVTGRAEHMENGSWINVVLWHGPSDFSFSGSTQVIDGKWTMSGIDITDLPSGERYSVVATAQNDSGTHANWTTFEIIPVPEPTHAFAHVGPNEFNGLKNTVLEFQNTTDFNLEEAAITFTFNADTVNDRMGLVSKDAFGRFENDGHFTSWLNGDDLHVRFQEGMQSKTFSVEGIDAHKDYTVTASFSDGKVALRVNGQLEGESEFDYSWLNNIEHLQIGANGWASRTGNSGFRDEFDGTIKEVFITELSTHTAADIHDLAMQDVFAM